MKKSKAIQLVLITAALASCNKKQHDDWNTKGSKTYVRADSTAPYARSHHGIGTGLLWFYAFRPYYGYRNGIFGRSGFYSNNISSRSNFGSNTTKSNSYRGGFGRVSRSGG